MTLLALNALWKLDLDLGTLTRISARLGSDVPYFLGGTALGLAAATISIRSPTCRRCTS